MVGYPRTEVAATSPTIYAIKEGIDPHGTDVVQGSRGVARVYCQVRMPVDLSRVHSRWLCGDAEAHMQRELGMFLFIRVEGFWPSRYRPRGEGSARKREQDHGVLAAVWRTL